MCVCMSKQFTPVKRSESDQILQATRTISLSLSMPYLIESGDLAWWVTCALLISPSRERTTPRLHRRALSKGGPSRRARRNGTVGRYGGYSRRCVQFWRLVSAEQSSASSNLQHEMREIVLGGERERERDRKRAAQSDNVHRCWRWSRGGSGSHRRGPSLWWCLLGVSG